MNPSLRISLSLLPKYSFILCDRKLFCLAAKLERNCEVCVSVLVQRSFRRIVVFVYFILLVTIYSDNVTLLYETNIPQRTAFALEKMLTQEHWASVNISGVRQLNIAQEFVVFEMRRNALSCLCLHSKFGDINIRSILMLCPNIALG